MPLPDGVATVSQRAIPPIERIFRYGLAGGTIAGLFSVLVVVLVRWAAAIGPIGASVIAFFIIQPVAYLLHRTITFPDADPTPDKTSTRVRRFLLSNTAGLVIVTGGMTLVTDVFHASYLWGLALNWVAIPGMNFMIYLWWVFNVRFRA